jgi:hypothetical protein
MKTIHPELLKVALYDYEAVKEEMNRPQHDVVTHSVCHLTRQAIGNFLKLYLDSKGVQYQSTDTMDYLISECKKLDPDFSTYDFGTLRCSHLSSQDDPSHYCLREEKVEHCFHLLEKLKAKIIMA